MDANSQDCQGPGQCRLTARWKWFYRASATTWPGADPVLELLLEARQCFFWARDQLYIKGFSTGPAIFSTDKKKTIYSQPEAFLDGELHGPVTLVGCISLQSQNGEGYYPNDILRYQSFNIWL